MPRANFIISERAKQRLIGLRAEHDTQSPGTPACVLSVGWGYVSRMPAESGNVAIGFYGQAQADEVAHGVQTVSGIDLVFFTTEALSRFFYGKVLDYEPQRGFFLAA